MSTLALYSQSGKKVRDIEIAEGLLAGPIRKSLLYYMVRNQLANRRAGTHSTKTRAMVTGSTKKIYRQKGTGRARHGSIRAPVFAGGGQAHPPKPRDWSYRPPRQMRIGALKSALSLFVKEGRLLVVDKIDLTEIKTKLLAGVFDKLQIARKALVVDDKSNENLKLSIRNMEDHQYLPPEGVNVYDLLRHDHLVVSKDAAKALEARCLNQRG